MRIHSKSPLLIILAIACLAVVVAACGPTPKPKSTSPPSTPPTTAPVSTSPGATPSSSVIPVSSNVTSPSVVATAQGAIKSFNPTGSVTYAAKEYSYSAISSYIHLSSGEPYSNQIWVVLCNGNFTLPAQSGQPTPSGPAPAIKSIAFFVDATNGQILTADVPSPPGLTA